MIKLSPPDQVIVDDVFTNFRHIHNNPNLIEIKCMCGKVFTNETYTCSDDLRQHLLECDQALPLNSGPDHR